MRNSQDHLVSANFCKFGHTEFANRYRCKACGYLTPVTEVSPERIYHACGLSWLQPPRSRGLGDTLAWLIKLITFGRIIPCNACNARRAWLNRLFPYR